MTQIWYRLEYSYVDTDGNSHSADLRFDTTKERSKRLVEILYDKNKKVTSYSLSDVFNYWKD